jgi:hypothetical protein
MTLLIRLWRGDLALDDAFWTWAVIGGLVVNAATSAAFLSLLMADRPILAVLVGYGLSLPYNVLVLVGVWRSAARQDADPRYANLARIATFIGFVLFTAT